MLILFRFPLGRMDNFRTIDRQTDHATIIDLIAATSTKTGLKVESALDTRIYEKGIRVTKAEMERLDIRGDAFHPEWNYSVVPQQPKS